MNLTQSFLVFAVNATACLILAAPAGAQGTAQERSACEWDAFRFCSGDIPFVSEIESCLQSNVRRLTPACRQEFLPTGETRLREEHFY
jgi:hypothetical protein